MLILVVHRQHRLPLIPQQVQQVMIIVPVINMDQQPIVQMFPAIAANAVKQLVESAIQQVQRTIRGHQAIVQLVLVQSIQG